MSKSLSLWRQCEKAKEHFMTPSSGKCTALPARPSGFVILNNAGFEDLEVYAASGVALKRNTNTVFLEKSYCKNQIVTNNYSHG